MVAVLQKAIYANFNWVTKYKPAPGAPELGHKVVVILLQQLKSLRKNSYHLSTRNYLLSGLQKIDKEIRYVVLCTINSLNLIQNYAMCFGDTRCRYLKIYVQTIPGYVLHG